jgi:hypothetical protein
VHPWVRRKRCRTVEVRSFHLDPHRAATSFDQCRSRVPGLWSGYVKARLRGGQRSRQRRHLGHDQSPQELERFLGSVFDTSHLSQTCDVTQRACSEVFRRTAPDTWSDAAASESSGHCLLVRQGVRNALLLALCMGRLILGPRWTRCIESRRRDSRASSWVQG